MSKVGKVKCPYCGSSMYKSCDDPRREVKKSTLVRKGNVKHHDGQFGSYLDRVQEDEMRKQGIAPVYDVYETHTYNYNFRTCKTCGYKYKALFKDGQLYDKKVFQRPDPDKIPKGGVVIKIEPGQGIPTDMELPWGKHNNDVELQKTVDELLHELTGYDDFGGS